MADAIYFDCDTGIDDAVALALLLRSPVELLGIGTVTGNIGADQAARNTLDLLALAGRTAVPVAAGAAHRLTGAAAPPAETGPGGVRSSEEHGGTVHGSNGIGGVELPRSGDEPIPVDAADLLVTLARSRPGELRVLATGPLTNLALALRREPRLPALVRDVTVMGGAVRAPGNITPFAEANIANDPEAAAEVLAAPWPVTLVPLDVTHHHCFEVTDQDALRAHGSALNVALADMLTAYLDYYEGWGNDGWAPARRVPLHDPLAAGILTGALTPGEAPLLGLRVDLGDNPGRIIEDPSVALQTRVILTLAEEGAPVIRTLIAP
jgi:purine nucleosidase